MHTKEEFCPSFYYTRNQFELSSHATYDLKCTHKRIAPPSLSSTMQGISQRTGINKLPTVTGEISTWQSSHAPISSLATLPVRHPGNEEHHLKRPRVDEVLERVAVVLAGGGTKSSIERDHNHGLMTFTALAPKQLSDLHLSKSLFFNPITTALTVSTCDVADPLTSSPPKEYEPLVSAASPRAAQQTFQDIEKRGNDELQVSHDRDCLKVDGAHPSPSSPGLVFHQEDLSDKDFRREALLGQGSYSIVTSATHLPSGRLFALKEISRFHLWQTRMDQQLQWEINLHRKLRHPNVLRLYSYYVTPRYIHLVLEFCPKGTILQRLRAAPGGRLGESQASRYARHVARALGHLHRNGIAHRDLKLENVLLDQRGVAKLADFGWSKVVCAGAEKDGNKGGEEGWAWPTMRRDVDRNTEEEAEEGKGERNEPHRDGTQGSSVSVPSLGPRFTVCGTLDYLSPEMLSGQPHTTKTDVWSLGAMIVEMITGQPPFYYASQQETLEAIRTKAPNLCGRRSSSYPKPTSTHSETVEENAVGQNGLAAGVIPQDETPVELSLLSQDLVLSMLNKSPDERPSIEQVLQHPWLMKKRS
ncbi:unnamed protein product [Phytomonas sp. Hart1]|nr:unnamed protein product [Phytomonas sp. Hart1]|eukprot:CCW67374.1 unnamed protein product [Phytomonas sp. isolate Hart1]